MGGDPRLDVRFNESMTAVTRLPRGSQRRPGSANADSM